MLNWREILPFESDMLMLHEKGVINAFTSHPKICEINTRCEINTKFTDILFKLVNPDAKMYSFETNELIYS